MDLPAKKVRIIAKAVRAIQRPSQTGDGDESGPTLSEMISDTRLPSPDEQVLEKDDLATIEHLLEVIDEREAMILRLRFGLDGHEPRTLKEIGQQIGLTRERVRQIEIEALRKLNGLLSSDKPLSARMEKKSRRGRKPQPTDLSALDRTGRVSA